MERYNLAKKGGSLRSFMQETMLRISSEEDRMIQDDYLVWFNRKTVLENMSNYSWYITTDFTTTGSKGSDLSGVALWAVTNNEDYLLVDISLGKKELKEQYDTVFKFASMVLNKGLYVEVGVEIDGQQKAHIFALKELMLKKNIFFTIGQQKGTNREGLLSNSIKGDKHNRFKLMLPYFQNKKIWFPNELKENPSMEELLEELKYVTYEGFNSKYDDGLDLISQLQLMNIFPPSIVTNKDDDGNFELDVDVIENSSTIF